MDTPSDGKVPFRDHLKAPIAVPLKAVQAVPLPTFVPFNWHKAHKAKLSRGERAADRMRNGMGSWTFVFGFLGFMAIWATLNTVGWLHHWDEYPFILLNLMLSMIAGLQGAILLIAAKRADAVSAAHAEHDYQTNVAAKKEVEQLMELHEKQLQRLDEILAILKAQHPHH
ncbi:MAG TPA: DUF1003 domain-containing protein [Candidatus Saccharimonadales bacterium]|nr:DUF1003 domain-containing protein [Candidatus Saccharimonadales bacterium]